MNRRRFLARSGGAAAALGIVGLAGCDLQTESTDESQEAPRPAPGYDTWEGVRGHFELDPALIHMSGLFIASHPTPVREAIERFRREQNANPAGYVEENMASHQQDVRSAAAAYLGGSPEQVALTNNTTMGTALAINGLTLREDQEMIAADFDYYSTHESMRYKANRSGASWRRYPLYDDVSSVTAEELVDAVLRQIRSETRLVTATWVHSSTGLKFPVRMLADELSEVNSGRGVEDRIIFFVDGVHGFGVETDQVVDLGCDLFSAGTHKWMHGPRGTGILWANDVGQRAVGPTIPTFTNGAGWGGRMSPGGFNAFEHHWALSEAFGFHENIGRERIADRIHELTAMLKEGLSDMGHVRLYTPMDPQLSSGMVCFDVDGMSQNAVVARLVEEDVIASATPYTPSYARLTPGIYNSEDDVRRTLELIADMG